MNEEDGDYHENHSKRSDKSKENLGKKDEKKGKKKVSFETRPKKIYGVPEEGTPINPKEKTKKTNKEKTHVTKIIEEASPIKEFDINELVEEENDEDDVTINELIK